MKLGCKIRAQGHSKDGGKSAADISGCPVAVGTVFSKEGEVFWKSGIF